MENLASAVIVLPIASPEPRPLESDQPLLGDFLCRALLACVVEARENVIGSACFGVGTGEAAE